jgi:hypothetical protein
MYTCILDYKHRLPSNSRRRRVGLFLAEVNRIGELRQFHDLASLDLNLAYHDENPAIMERVYHDDDYENDLDEGA